MPWALPTYNRPKECIQVLEQIKKVGCATPGIVIVQGERKDANADIAEHLPDNWQIEYLEQNIGVCAAMNLVYRKFPAASFYGLICDDEYVFTPGWDIALTERAGDWHISHANDGWQSQRRIHSYVTVGGALARACGWWALPGLWHWFHDDVQEAIAGELGLRRFCPDIKSAHRHYISGNAPKDLTYATGESRASRDAEIFRHWKIHEWPPLREKIRKMMK